MRPWKLAETNYGAVRDERFEVAVLPLGATEPHNLHLPYGTDTLESDAIGERLCESVWQRGARVLLLPTIPYGTETNLAAFPLALNLNPSTLARVIEDLVASLVGSGLRKIVLLNSHGGNDLFDEPDDHAGEMETSLALAYFPELVARRADGSLTADEGRKRATRFAAVNRGWVQITRPWHLLTTHTGAGNPHAATAAKGRQAMDLLIAGLSDFLVELAETPLDDSFPY